MSQASALQIEGDSAWSPLGPAGETDGINHQHHSEGIGLRSTFPDRVADVAIFACAGYATGCVSGEVLGWLCACGAVATAYVRVLGTALCGSNDFRGIMAKPQRMAAMTAVS